MLLATRRLISMLTVTNIITTVCRGQSYADRSGNVHAGDVAYIAEEEGEYSTEYYYDWSPIDSNILLWNVEKYPHPQLEPSSCGRKVPSNVCDPDHILTEQQADQLDSLVRQIYNDTTCICDVCGKYNGGMQIGIALFMHSFQPYNEHPSKIIHSFSKNLRSKWRLGECEDDLLIVVVTKDRQSYTDLGQTTLRYISRAEAYSIFLESKAHFSQGQYFEGLKEMLQHYQKATEDIAKDKDSAKKQKLNVSEVSGIVIVILIGVFIAIIVLILFYKRYKKTKGSSEQDKKGDTDTSSWCCKIPFTSNSDDYQPCSTQDDGQIPLKKEKYEKKDEQEVINTEIALQEANYFPPPPPPLEESNNGDSDKNADDTSAVNKTDSGYCPSVIPTITDRVDDSSHQHESLNRTEPNGAKFTTFVPKNLKEFHQTDL